MKHRSFVIIIFQVGEFDEGEQEEEGDECSSDDEEVCYCMSPLRK